MSMNKINSLSYVEERMVLVVKIAQSCPTLRPHGLYSPWNSPGQNIGRELPFPPANPHLLHWQADSLLLSHQGSL